MTTTVFLILLICLLTMRFFFTCMIVLLIGVFVLAEPPRAHAEDALAPYHYDASNLNHKNDANWRKTVDRIKKLSAIQNHGSPVVDHTCYAEDKKTYCATAVWYMARDGRQAFVRVIRRGDNDDFIGRDVCRFNKDMSRRTCINFDDGYTSQWVKYGDGVWIQIDKEKSDNDAASGGL